MKKIIILILSILISISLNNITSADNLDKKLAKKIIITKLEIKNGFENGEEINQKIIDLFIDYRYNKDLDSISKLKEFSKEKILEINQYDILGRNKRVKLSLYENIYSRSSYLLDYILK